MNKGEKVYMQIIEHYENCLEKHGDSHLGVDWPRGDDADMRHQVMLDVIRDEQPNRIELLDFGCGASHLYEFIINNGYKNIIYSGLEISPKYIQLCKNKYPDVDYYCLDLIEDEDKLKTFDYIVMNGVFTEKQSLSNDQMFDYFKILVKKVFAKAKIGIAFNVMSKAVDWEREDLFHLAIDPLVDFMTKNLSRHFIIRNDYGLYEYTVYLYKKTRNKLCLK